MSTPRRGHEVKHRRRLRLLVRPHRARLAAMIVVAFLGGAAEAALLVIITRMALAVADGRDETGVLMGWSVTIGQAVAIAALLVVCRLAFALAGSALSTGLTAQVRTSIRHRLARAYLDSTWAVQQSEPAGRLSQLLTAFANEAASAVTAMGQTLTASLNLSALVLGALLVDPVSTAVVVLALVGLAGVLAPLRRRLRLRSKAAAGAQLEFATAVAELGSLGLEMQTFGTKDRFEERIDQLIEQDVRARRRSDLLRSALPSVYISLAYGALLGGLALAGLAGAGKLSALGAVMLVMLRSLSYGQALQVASAAMMQSLPFLDQLDETEARYLAAPASGGSEIPARLGAIEARDVAFGYDPARPVLDDVSFTIEPGATVGIIGPSGSGKSTLVQLLLGVRDPSAGSVLVDGTDLRDVDRRWWTERVAFVAQDALLFAGTVAENVRFFREGITDSDLRRAAQQAHLLREIETLVDGFDTHLGERGSQLSGGQRQRLSIARALAGSPSLLILDEPTSALDVDSEVLIRQTLDELPGDVTVVIIAHRLSTLEMCDRLLVVDGGRIVAAGRPEELRAGNAFYRRALELSGIS